MRNAHLVMAEDLLRFSFRPSEEGVSHRFSFHALGANYFASTRKSTKTICYEKRFQRTNEVNDACVNVASSDWEGMTNNRAKLLFPLDHSAINSCGVAFLATEIFF